jgi:hypothetical protein
LRNGAIPNTSTSLSISTAVIVPFILLSSLYWVSEKSTIKKTWKNINDVSDCCLMPNKQYFTYFIVKQVTFVEMSSSKIIRDHVCGVMVSMLAFGVVALGFQPWSAQAKNYKIGICCLSNN